MKLSVCQTCGQLLRFAHAACPGARFIHKLLHPPATIGDGARSAA
jgi:hypothetical protein